MRDHVGAQPQAALLLAWLPWLGSGGTGILLGDHTSGRSPGVGPELNALHAQHTLGGTLTVRAETSSHSLLAVVPSTEPGRADAQHMLMKA